MKITIDTKEDSHQEIRKIIRMLSSLVGEKEVFSNQKDVFSDGSDNEDTGSTESSGGTGMFNMFGSSTEKKSEDETSEETKKKDEVDLGIPEFEEYD